MNLDKIKKGLKLYELVDRLVEENQDKVYQIDSFDDYYGLDQDDFFVRITYSDILTYYFIKHRDSNKHISIDCSSTDNADSTTVVCTDSDLDFMLDLLSK